MNPPLSTRDPLDTAASRSLLEVRGLTAGYPGQSVLRDVSFQVEQGQTLVVLGDSGCGKSTLLKALAGFLPLEAGEVQLAARRIDELPAGQRDVVYLDQEPLLFEHLDVAENVGFALNMRGRPAAEIEREVDALLTAVDMHSHRHKREWQLSGGQKQRVAFARAIVPRPQLLLLDEPFSSLDGRSRTLMQSLYAELRRRYALTSLFVTHDVKEALTVGDRFSRLSDAAIIVYPDRPSFMHDAATGIPDEIAFWRDQAP
jgi:putrescine transport system ATP-binding protein